MMMFSTFLFVFLNWSAIWQCRETQCKYVPLIRDDVWMMNAFHIIVILFETVVLIYWLSLFINYSREILSMISIKSFYNNDLNITEQDIQTIQWVEVINKIINLQNSRKIYVLKNIDELGKFICLMRL